MDRGQTELQLNNAKLCNAKNSSIKVIVNGRLNMLSRSYIYVNVSTVRGTQPVKIICLDVMQDKVVESYSLWSEDVSIISTSFALGLICVVAHKTTEVVS